MPDLTQELERIEEAVPNEKQGQAESADPGGFRKSLRRPGILAILSWLYALLIVLLLILIRWVGASFWGTSLILLMPRWLLLIPPAFLALICLPRSSRRHWFVQAASALAVLGPLMGFSIPITQLLSAVPEGETIRVVSFNLGNDPIQRDRWIAWMVEQKIDIILLQEPYVSWKGLHAALKEKGWIINKPKTIATRFRVVDDLEPLSDQSTHGRRFSARLFRERLETPTGRKIVVASAHMPTLRFGVEDFVETKRSAILAAHDEWWGLQLARVLSLCAETTDEPMLIGGDFNLPSDDSRLYSLRSSFRFAFEEAGWGYGYTRPSKFPWVRIDHILSTPEWYVKRCWVGPDFGSDHLPIVAEFVLPRSIPGI